MMQSAHSPTPESNGMPPTEEFDDPFKTTSSNLDDLTLDSEHNKNDNSDEADPWAVLAAAAGEDAPPPAPAASESTPHTSAETAVPATAVPPSTQHNIIETTTLEHHEGETFSMPTHEPPSLASQIRSSTANLTSTLSHKIQEVDTKTGISTKTKELDDQYHISEKWSTFQTNVIIPTTTKTVEKTKEVSTSVKEKVAPSVKEHWGSIKQRTTELGITEKWSSLSSKVGAKLNETKENVEHWKEEQEKKKALANSNISNGGEGGQQQMIKQPIINEQQKEQIQQNIEATKEKVKEGWAGGMNWLSSRIQQVHAHQQQRQQGNGVQDYSAGNGGGGVSRMDSDGLPTSFRRD